jgi:hypothetical protein
MKKHDVPQPQVNPVTNKLYPTREAWLEAATSEFSIHFLQAGFPLPPLVKVSCAFTSGGTRKHRNNKVQIGECWDASRSGQGAVEIMVSPIKDDAVEVAATLFHELCHAANGVSNGHRGDFAKLARSGHLEGPLPQTKGGKEFAEWVKPVLKRLGTYPHAALDTSKRTKQTTRLLKVWCKHCGYTVRVTATWLVKGYPICPVKGHGAMADA